MSLIGTSDLRQHRDFSFTHTSERFPKATCRETHSLHRHRDIDGRSESRLRQLFSVGFIPENHMQDYEDQELFRVIGIIGNISLHNILKI